MAIPFFHQLAKFVAPRHYFALLVSLLGLTLLAPLVEHSLMARLVVGGMLFASLLTATLAIKRNTRTSVILIALAVLSGVMWILALCEHAALFNTLLFQSATDIFTLLFFIIICYLILQDVFQSSINSNKICGAICVYLLVGFCFALLHMMIDLCDRNAYKDNTGTIISGPSLVQKAGLSTTTDKRSEWLSTYPIFAYFSFCTFSTLGYGDIIPVSRLARCLSCMEATLGQLYLAVLVARLVGLHTASISVRHRKELQAPYIEEQN